MTEQDYYNQRVAVARSKLVMARGQLEHVEERIASAVIEINDLKKYAYQKGLKVD